MPVSTSMSVNVNVSATATATDSHHQRRKGPGPEPRAKRPHFRGGTQAPWQYGVLRCCGLHGRGSKHG